jgi:hypothetical protein
MTGSFQISAASRRNGNRPSRLGPARIGLRQDVREYLRQAMDWPRGTGRAPSSRHGRHRRRTSPASTDVARSAVASGMQVHRVLGAPAHGVRDIGEPVDLPELVSRMLTTSRHIARRALPRAM